jgi:trigger factor
MVAHLEALDGLDRKLTVTVPSEQVATAWKGQLNKIKGQAKVSGFRPGKVPLHLLEKKYGQSIEAEVVSELMRSSFDGAIAEASVEIAGTPKVEPKPLSKGEDFVYEVTFQVYPTIALKDLSLETITRQVAEVTGDDVDHMIDKIRQQHATWLAVSRAAQDGDRLTIDFAGKIDGELFEGGEAEGFSLTLGEGQMIPGFESGLIGAMPGESREVPVTFPEEYGAQNLAGKDAVFSITVQTIEAPELPAVDQALLDQLKVKGDLESFRAQVEEGLAKEVKQGSRNQVKTTLFDQLLAQHAVELPTELVDREISAIHDGIAQRMGIKKEAGKSLDLPREPYVKEAEKRVALGLLLREWIRHFEIQLDPADVRAKVEEIAATYESPEQVVNWYYQQKGMLAEIETLLLEDRVVDRLLETMTVVDESVDCQSLLAKQE